MTINDPYNAANPEAVRKAVKAERAASTQRAEILRGLMSLPAGRAWVFHQLEACHIFLSTYTGDSLSMAFKEGERNVGLRLLSDVMATCPDQFVQAMREAHDRSSSTNAPADSGPVRPGPADSFEYADAEPDPYSGTEP